MISCMAWRRLGKFWALGVTSDESRWTIEDGCPKKTAGVYSFKLLLLYLQYPCQEKDLRHINEAIQLWLNLLLLLSKYMSDGRFCSNPEAEQLIKVTNERP
jgi:hypothetical protein